MLSLIRQLTDCPKYITSSFLYASSALYNKRFIDAKYIRRYVPQDRKGSLIMSGMSAHRDLQTESVTTVELSISLVKRITRPVGKFCCCIKGEYICYHFLQQAEDNIYCVI